MIQTELRDKIRLATVEIGVAERELADVLQAMRAAPRVDKTFMSEALERALDKLKAARGVVSELETLLAVEDRAT